MGNLFESSIRLQLFISAQTCILTAQVSLTLLSGDLLNITPGDQTATFLAVMWSPPIVMLYITYSAWQSTGLDCTNGLKSDDRTPDGNLAEQFIWGQSHVHLYLDSNPSGFNQVNQIV